MGHQDESGPLLFVEPKQEFNHVSARCGVEITRRLIGEQNDGLRSEGARYGNTLLLTTGKCSGVMMLALTQTHAGKKLLRLFTRMLNACKLERQHHVLERRQCGQ